MSTTTYTELTPEFLDHARRLTEADKLRLFDMMYDETDHKPEPLTPEWKAEILRRAEELISGKDKGYTLEETLAYIAELRQSVSKS